MLVDKKIKRCKAETNDLLHAVPLANPLTVSNITSLVEEIGDISISLPNWVGGDGIIETLQLSLDSKESAKLKLSAEILEGEIENLNLG